MSDTALNKQQFSGQKISIKNIEMDEYGNKPVESILRSESQLSVKKEQGNKNMTVWVPNVEVDKKNGYLTVK